MEIQKQEVILKIEDLTKSFGKTEVLKGIGMEVHKNEIISVWVRPAAENPPC